MIPRNRIKLLALTLVCSGLLFAAGCRCQQFEGHEYIGPAPEHPGSSVIVYTFPDIVNPAVHPIYLDMDAEGRVTAKAVLSTGEATTELTPP